MKKVSPGDKLLIPASTYNAFVDAARANRTKIAQGETKSLFTDTILIRNDTEEVVTKGNVLGLGDVLFVNENLDPPTPNVATPIGFSGVIPLESLHASKFVIVYEDRIPKGALGRAYIDGVRFVKVYSESDVVVAADVQSNSIVGLKSNPNGIAQVIWRHSGVGLQWAVVRIGGMGGGGVEGLPLPCKVVDVDPVNQCAFVSLIKEGVDPSDPVQWTDPNNFELKFPVWTAGLTLARPGNPAIVLMSPGRKPWLFEKPNFVGVDYRKSCEPEGRLAPSIPRDCDDPPTPEAFTTTFACSLEGGCQELTLCDCVVRGGTPLIDLETNSYQQHCPPLGDTNNA